MTTHSQPGLSLRCLLAGFRRRPRDVSAPRSRRRRARSVLLAGVLLCVAAVLGMGVAVETVAPQWRDPEYGHRLAQVRHWKKTRPDRPLVVAVGSSRTQMGLSPADM